MFRVFKLPIGFHEISQLSSPPSQNELPWRIAGSLATHYIIIGSVSRRRCRSTGTPTPSRELLFFRNVDVFSALVTSLRVPFHSRRKSLFRGTSRFLAVPIISSPCQPAAFHGARRAGTVDQQTSLFAQQSGLPFCFLARLPSFGFVWLAEEVHDSTTCRGRGTLEVLSFFYHTIFSSLPRKISRKQLPRTIFDILQPITRSFRHTDSEPDDLSKSRSSFRKSGSQ